MRRIAATLLALAVLAPPGARAAVPMIATVAGGGVGDGGLATSALLRDAEDGAFDSAGNLYIADTGHRRVRKVTVAGTITTIAGTGETGSDPDGPALATRIRPVALAVGPGDVLYIGEPGRIRRLDIGGTLTTIAGTGEGGYSGDGGQATQAKVSVDNIATDASGAVYFPDGARIRKVAGGMITSILGSNPLPSTIPTSQGGFPAALTNAHPNRIAVTPAGEVYYAELSGSRILKVNAAGVVVPVMGYGTSQTALSGLALLASVQYVSDLALDAAGNLSFDTFRWLMGGMPAEYAVNRVDSNGVMTRIHTSYFLDRGRLVSGPGGRIVTVGATSVDALDGTRLAGGGTSGGDGGPATSAMIRRPRKAAALPDGTLYVADLARVRRVAPGGSIETVLDTAGMPVEAVAISPAGEVYAIVWNAIVRLTTPGSSVVVAGSIAEAGYSGDGGPAELARFGRPQDMAFDAAGALYVADYENHCVRRIAPDGAVTTVAGNGTPGFVGDGGPAVDASLNRPIAVATHPGGAVFVADRDNKRIRRISGGTIDTYAGTGTPGPSSGDGGAATAARVHATGLAVGPDGVLYLSDDGAVRRVLGSGIIETFAGGLGTTGFAGDGGPALGALLDGPGLLSFGPDGALYAASTERIRRIA